MTRENFYILIDPQSDLIINHPTELPENWNNIHGLTTLSDEEISDLNWAGRPNFGWVKFNSEFPENYVFGDNWMSFAKLSIKEVYSKKRWEAESKGILYKNIEIKTDDRTKTTIILKKDLLQNTPSQTFNWKSGDVITTFDVEDAIKISASIDDYIQQCFDVEATLIEQINLAETPSDLAEFNVNVTWPTNVYND